MNNTILVINGREAHKSAKIDWPDLNYPGSGQTILRVVYQIDYTNLKFQLDDEQGPWFNQKTAPEGVAFYKIIS
jgi:hypothetical protein